MGHLSSAKTEETSLRTPIVCRFKKTLWKSTMLFIMIVSCLLTNSYAQAPTLSYGISKTYSIGSTIAPLTPVSSAVGAPSYGTPVNIEQQYKWPLRVTADFAGNIYFSELDSIEEIPVNGGGEIFRAMVISSGSGYAMTLDKNGNFYYCGFSGLYKIATGDSRSVVIASGILTPYGIAVDALGNVFTAIEADSTVIEILANTGAIRKVGSGFSHPTDVTMDSFGNLYIADTRNRSIKKIPAGGNSAITLSTEFIDPTNVAVDASGNVYVVDQGRQRANPTLYELPVGNGPPTTLFNGIGVITGVCAAPYGVLYMTTDGFGDVGFLLRKAIPSGGYYLKTPLPAGLTLNAATGVVSGTPTVASPATDYTIMAYNASGGTPATVNIGVSVPANLALSNLTISTLGILTPVFNSNTNNYTTAVGNGINSISITPTKIDPTSTIKVNGVIVASGTASTAIPLAVGPNTIKTVVTAQNGLTNNAYTLTVMRAPSNNAKLLRLTTSSGGLTPAFNNTVTSYTRSVANEVTSITITPTAVDPTASIMVNGVVVASGTASGSIALNAGANVINTVVTAQDGITKITYTTTVNRAAIADATLSNLAISAGIMKPAFATATTAYTVAVGNGITSVTVTPTPNQPDATIKVNGIAVTPGAASGLITLAVGTTTITTVIIAPNGVTTKNYKIAVTRAPSSIAKLTSLNTSNGALTPAFNNAQPNYTRNVPSSVDSITLTAKSASNGATIMIAGQTTPSGVGVRLALAPGNNYENILVTAQDNVTTMIYSVNVVRAMGAADAVYEPVIVEKPLTNPTINDNDINVHQSLSPNGDGINDFLVIENIVNYPDNKLTITNRNGQLVYEGKNYDNSSKVFDGHSNKTGAMQLPGTYFYSLDYSSGGVMKHKTGFIVLKY